MSPRKVYSFYCLLFSLTGAITIIRSVQWHFLVTRIPSVSQMLLAIALQWLLLREWVKMSCFPSLLFLHSSILSQEKHTLHLTLIISSLSFLGSTKDVNKCPTRFWYQHFPWKHSTDPHQGQTQAPEQSIVSVKGEEKNEAVPKKQGCPWRTALCLQFWMEGDQAAQQLTTHGSCSVGAKIDTQQLIMCPLHLFLL